MPLPETVPAIPETCTTEPSAKGKTVEVQGEPTKNQEPVPDHESDTKPKDGGMEAVTPELEQKRQPAEQLIGMVLVQ